MKLSIKERVILPGLLQLSRGNLSVLREAQSFMKDIAIGELEQKEIGLRQVGTTGYTWSPLFDSEEHWIEFAISPALLANIVGCLKAADAMNSLTLEHLPIYDRFVAEAGEVKPPSKVRTKRGETH